MSVLGNKGSAKKSAIDSILPMIKEEPAFEDGASPLGRNLAIVGADSVGKTTFALLLGYLNSQFKDRMGDDLKKTKKALSNGAIPEVERIVVVETQNKLKKTLRSTCVERALLKPLNDAGIKIDIINVNLKRAKERIKN
jgi:hypothetical protein